MQKEEKKEKKSAINCNWFFVVVGDYDYVAFRYDYSAIILIAITIRL